MKKEIIEVYNKITVIEKKLKEFNYLKKESEELRAKLYEAMINNDCKKWETPNHTKITVVEEILPTTTTQLIFNEEKFILENPDLYEKYQEEKEIIKNGRKGYIKITPPKEVK